MAPSKAPSTVGPGESLVPEDRGQDDQEDGDERRKRPDAHQLLVQQRVSVDGSARDRRARRPRLGCAAGRRRCRRCRGCRFGAGWSGGRHRRRSAVRCDRLRRGFGNGLAARASAGAVASVSCCASGTAGHACPPVPERGSSRPDGVVFAIAVRLGFEGKGLGH